MLSKYSHLFRRSLNRKCPILFAAARLRRCDRHTPSLLNFVPYRGVEDMADMLTPGSCPFVRLALEIMNGPSL